MQDQAIEVLKLNTALRAEDVHGLFDKFITKQLPSVKHGTPRSLKLVMTQTKNDKKGTGPVADRTNYVPCICVRRTEDPSARKVLDDLYKVDIDAKCTIRGCAFGILVAYIDLCPEDPHKDLHLASK